MYQVHSTGPSQCTDTIFSTTTPVLVLPDIFRPLPVRLKLARLAPLHRLPRVPAQPRKHPVVAAEHAQVVFAPMAVW